MTIVSGFVNFNYYQRAQSGADCLEEVGNLLRYPALRLFGKVYHVENKTFTEEPALKTVAKVFLAAILILFAPLSIPLTLIGTLLTVLSKSYKNCAREHEAALKALSNDKPAAETPAATDDLETAKALKLSEKIKAAKLEEIPSLVTADLSKKEVRVILNAITKNEKSFSDSLKDDQLVKFQAVMKALTPKQLDELLTIDTSRERETPFTKILEEIESIPLNKFLANSLGFDLSSEFEGLSFIDKCKKLLDYKVFVREMAEEEKVNPSKYRTQTKEKPTESYAEELVDFEDPYTSTQNPPLKWVDVQKANVVKKTEEEQQKANGEYEELCKELKAYNGPSGAETLMNTKPNKELLSKVLKLSSRTGHPLRDENSYIGLFWIAQSANVNQIPLLMEVALESNQSRHNVRCILSAFANDIFRWNSTEYDKARFKAAVKVLTPKQLNALLAINIDLRGSFPYSSIQDEINSIPLDAFLSCQNALPPEFVKNCKRLQTYQTFVQKKAAGEIRPDCG